VLHHSPAAQRALAAWHERLQPFNRPIAPVTPPARVWRAIVQRTRPASAQGSWLGKFFASWARPALAFGFGLVLTVGFIHQTPQTVGLQPTASKLAASYVGLLTDSNDTPVLSASSLRQGKILSVKILKALQPPLGQIVMLWALPEGGAPIPIGTVPLTGKADLALTGPAELLFSKVPKLALSYEADAAVTAPHGPIVASGHCVKIW
jgi:anti-sigma-K factor RskA